MLAAAPPAGPFAPPLLLRLRGSHPFAFAVIIPVAKLPKRRVRASRPLREAAVPDEMAGAAGLAALKSYDPQLKNRRHSPPPAPAPSSSTAVDPSEAGEKELNKRDGTLAAAEPLRGSVVLQALQRAVAKREEKRRKKKSGKNWRPSPASGGELPAEIDYKDVRPIEIRSDWSQRIDELEKRVRELQARYN